MNEEWVDRNLGRLSDALVGWVPLECTYEFDPDQGFYDRLFQAVNFEWAVQQLCSHIKLPNVPEVEIVGDSDVPVLDLEGGLRFFDKVISSSGDYTSKAPLDVRIRVGASHFRHVHILGHILAHEMAHHYLLSRLVRPEDETENEMYTDLAAVYLGFGKLMLNGAMDLPPESVLKPIHLSEDGVPYLGYPLLAYSYYRCHLKRKTGWDTMYNYLEAPCATMVKAFSYHDESHWSPWKRLLVFVGLRPRLPHSDGARIVAESWRYDSRRFRIVNCIACDGQLKIPNVEKPLEIRCPKCGKEFRVEIRHKDLGDGA